MASGKQKSVRRTDAESELVRRFKANPFVFVGTIVVLVIVIIAFVLVPAIVPSAEFSGASLTFGSWDGKPIKYTPNSYFARARSNYERYAQYNGLQNSEYQVWRAAFEDTVFFTAAQGAMKKAGYAPPDDVVNRQVAGLSIFQENGRFSTTKFRETPKTERLALWDEVRDSLMVQRYQNDLAAIRYSPDEAAFAGKMASPSRSFALAAFPVSSYPDSEVAAYMDLKAALFRTVHLSQISVNSSENDAKKILATINDGTSSFEDSARASSQDSYADLGGDAGAKLAHEYVSVIPDEQTRNTVLGLNAGELSDVVKTADGWGIFKAIDTPKPAHTDDPAALEKARSYILANERGRVDDYLLAKASDFARAARENGFDEELEAQSLTKKEFGPLPINYGGSSLFAAVSSFGIDELSAAETSDIFWRTAFSTPIGEASDPIVLGSNVVVLYPVSEEDAEKAETNAKNTESSYETVWERQVISEDIRRSVIESPRLQDDFLSTYFSLYQG